MTDAKGRKPRPCTCCTASVWCVYFLGVHMRCRLCHLHPLSQPASCSPHPDCAGPRAAAPPSSPITRSSYYVVSAPDTPPLRSRRAVDCDASAFAPLTHHSMHAIMIRNPAPLHLPLPVAVQLHRHGPLTPPAGVEGRVAAHLRRFHSEILLDVCKLASLPLCYTLRATQVVCFAKSRDVHDLRLGTSTSTYLVPL